MATPRNPIEAFIWGGGGAALSPEQVAERRRRAQELAAQEVPGLGHWAASLNQGLTGFLGGRERRMADEAEAAGREGYQSAWDSVFGGGQTASVDPVAAALTGSPQTASDATAMMAGAPSIAPTGDQASYIRNGLLQRGLPEHVADAFLMNFQDESGLNAGINEAKPLVPGSRGGYGLYQLTGPRRRAYEAYAQQNGIPLDSIDGQLDFMMGELAGSESAAARSILSAPDTGSAAAAIVNQFLRPAEEHRARRVAKYTGGGAQAPAGNQVAQALMGSGQADPTMQQLMALAGNEWGNSAQQSIVQSLIGQQMQAQQQANDPMRQMQLAQGALNLERGQFELDQLRNAPPPLPGAPKTEKMFDPATGREQIMQWDGASGQWTPLGGVAAPKDPLVNVNTGDAMPGLGKLSTDFTYITDPATGLPVIDPSTNLPTAAPVPGSPAALSAAQATAAAGSQANAQLTSDIEKAGTTLAATGSLLDILDNSEGQPTTGTLSIPFGLYSGSPAGKVRSYVSTLQSGVALGAMQRLKEASATGATGFGALSAPELNLLISDIGALNPDNTEPEIFRQTVARIDERSKRVVADIRKNVSPERIAELGLTDFLNSIDPPKNSGKFDYNSATPPDGWGGDHALWRFMSPEDRALW